MWSNKNAPRDGRRYHYTIQRTHAVSMTSPAPARLDDWQARDEKTTEIRLPSSTRLFQN